MTGWCSSNLQLELFQPHNLMLVLVQLAVGVIPTLKFGVGAGPALTFVGVNTSLGWCSSNSELVLVRAPN